MITHSLDETPGAVVEQPTQPIEPQRASPEAVVEQQPTQPIEPQCEMCEEQPTLALSLKEEFAHQRASPPAVPRRSRLKMRWLVLIPLYILLIGGGLLGRVAAVNWMATKSATPQSTPVFLHVRRTTAHSSAIDSAARGFMQAMMSKDWTAMWPMLSPDAQRLFQGKQDFTRFEQAKFGDITLISFQASAAQLQQPWLDPDTTLIYPIAATLQISLEATAPKGVLTGPSMTDLDNGLFHNTLLSLVPRN